MQTNTKNDGISTRIEVIITLEGGKKVIVDAAPLRKLFEYGGYSQPSEVAERFQRTMDHLVIFRADDEEISLTELKEDYEFLITARDAFAEMFGKEVNGE